MDKPKPNALNELFTMIENRLRRETLNAIHKEIDLDHMAALGEWWSGRGLSVSAVMSITAYFLAHTIYEEAPDEDEACAGVQAYNDYMHCAVHRLYEEYPKDGISSEPEPPRSKKH